MRTLLLPNGNLEGIPYADEDFAASVRAAKQPGFRLVNAILVGLPVYRITLDCLVLQRKGLQTIDEFVMKSVAAGLVKSEEISGLLGLATETVNNSVVELQRRDELDFSCDEIRLTPRGRLSLAESSQIQPETRRLDIKFDGLLRRCEPFNPASTISAQQAKEAGLELIPSATRVAPRIEDLSVKMVDRYLKTTEEDTGLIDVLAIRRIHQLHQLFQVARALVFKAIDGDEIQIAFTVNDLFMQEQSEAFSAGDSDTLRRIRLDLGRASKQRTDSRLPKQIREKLPSEEELNLTEKLLSDLQLRTAKAKANLARSSGSERLKCLETLEDLELRHAECLSQKEALPVRWLRTAEHRSLLKQSIRSATTVLMITSPRICASVVDSEILDLLSAAVKRGVSIILGHGERGGMTGKSKQEARFAKRIQSLEALPETPDFTQPPCRG